MLRNQHNSIYDHQNRYYVSIKNRAKCQNLYIEHKVRTWIRIYPKTVLYLYSFSKFPKLNKSRQCRQEQAKHHFKINQSYPDVFWEKTALLQISRINRITNSDQLFEFGIDIMSHFFLLSHRC